MSRLITDPINSPGDPAPIPPSPTPTPSPAPPPSTPSPTLPAPPIPLPPAPPTGLPVPPAPSGPPRYVAADYASAAQAPLPRGRVWEGAPDGPRAMLLLALMQTLERIDAAASTLLAGSLPGSALSGFLPEWEATLGLPDPCAGDSPSFSDRAAQVIARFVGAGGQSRSHYIAFADALGFEITITNFQPFRAGRSTMGDPLASDARTFVWGVTIVTNRYGLDPALLLCELWGIKPAETTVVLIGTDPGTASMTFDLTGIYFDSTLVTMDRT